jgi:acyl-CoA dehydrogenase
MNLELSAEDLAFQQEVRAFLRENLPVHLVEAARRTTTVFVDREITLEWQAILARRGWAVPAWPVEWGGTGWTPTQRYLFDLECYRAGAPRLVPLGLGMLAPVLLAFGTEEQKRHYLPRILSGEHYWCQGYSEPGSGSDLASLQLRAERSDGHYVLNGSKLWTTHGHFADHIFCLVRTDNSGKPQQGISFLLVPLDLPGIEVRPIITMGMSHEVNEVFFQDVEVPLANLVGEEGKGWTCAKYLLEFERGGGSTAALRQHDLDALSALLASMREADPAFDADGHFRKRMARIAIDITALEMTELRILATLAAGGNPGAESSVLKITTVDIEQRMHELGIDLLGHRALVFTAEVSTTAAGDTGVPEEAAAFLGRYLNGRAASIFGGSHEVQRNIIAKSVLGL